MSDDEYRLAMILAKLPPVRTPAPDTLPSVLHRRLHKKTRFLDTAGRRRLWLISRYDEQRGACYYCGALMSLRNRDIPGLMATVDHYMPLSRGGPDAYENVVAACADCNSAKGDLPPIEFIAIIQSVLDEASEPG